jgi:hypothetical protein
MNDSRKQQSRFRIACAVVLIVLGGFIGIAWITWGAPLWRSVLYDSLALYGGNSRTWWEAHRSAAKAHWRHDDFVEVGSSATKEDLKWIISDGAAGADFDSCDAGHRASALEIISNQTPGGTREAWQKWWQDHQHETQNQWILDGFAKWGLPVSFPLERGTTLALLRLIGRGTFSPTEGSRHGEVPRHIRNNALRLLRDVDFKAESITAQEISDESTGDLWKGVLEYTRWQAANPRENGVGVVFANASKLNGPFGLRSAMADWAPWIWPGLAVICLVGGLLLVRRRKKAAASPV